MVQKLFALLLLIAALLFWACESSPNGPHETKGMDTVYVDTGSADTVFIHDTVSSMDSTPIDTVLHAPNSHRCVVGQVDTLMLSVTPSSLHQSVTLLSDDAGIAAVSGNVVTCMKLGTTFLPIKWTNGFIERKDTILVMVRPPS